MTPLLYAIQILSALPNLISAGLSISNVVSTANNALAQMVKENRDPTDAEWQALNDEIAALQKQLHS